jgi:hypothetical protein
VRHYQDKCGPFFTRPEKKSTKTIHVTHSHRGFLFVDVYLFLSWHAILELFDQILFKMFVPILFEISVCAVKRACPLLLVKINLISLVDKVGREEEYS